MTRGVNELITKDYHVIMDLNSCIAKHLNCDWGDLSKYDKNLNDDAVKNGGRILSAYTIGENKVKIWIITEWDRSCTTILLPEEY
jgi:hypothetical protein